MVTDVKQAAKLSTLAKAFAILMQVTNNSSITDAWQEFQDFFNEPNAFRSVIILIVSLIVAYWLSRFLAQGIVRIAQAVSKRSDNESNAERLLRLRQIETYLSVTVAAVRAFVVAIVGYIGWKVLSPTSSSGAAAIGASTIFVVFAGATLSVLLRDITTGATMIFEQWFNVGDYIRIEPFTDLSGVVEKMTLRSTKLRQLSGEIIWIHNQHIQAVHATPNGVRTIAVDVFVKDLELGKKAITEITDVIPTGTTMLARALRITETEKWGDDLWRMTVTGQTMPGREWLIENYFVNALKTIDEGKDQSEKITLYDPIVRFADPTADKRFRRAVRASQDK